MTKEEIKTMLEGYKFEFSYYDMKRKKANKFKDMSLKTIQILREMNQEQNKQLINDIILSYTKDIIEQEASLAELNKHLKEIENLLDCVSQPNKTVLYYKYIDGLSVEEIATKMNYSTQRIYQFHDSGLNQILENAEKEDAV